MKKLLRADRGREAACDEQHNFAAAMSFFDHGLRKRDLELCGCDDWFGSEVGLRAFLQLFTEPPFRNGRTNLG